MTEHSVGVLQSRWTGLIGALSGSVWSASGLVSILSFFGFWMGGALVLVVTAPLGLWYATSRQRAARHAITLAAAFVVGLVPGALKEASELEAFWVSCFSHSGSARCWRSHWRRSMSASPDGSCCAGIGRLPSDVARQLTIALHMVPANVGAFIERACRCAQAWDRPEEHI
jgi:hypothetical protein